MTQPGTRKQVGFENILLCCAGLVLLVSIACAILVRMRLGADALGPVNQRVRYGLEHLPGALVASLLFLVLLTIARTPMIRNDRWRELPTRYFVAALIAAFCLFWLPPVLAGGFDKDDWMLLGAASIRTILATHPSLLWSTLDSVDGNFRPLGTALYMGTMLRHFGIWARPFLAGLFLVNLLGTLVAFAIAIRLGYTRVTATAAALLYLSRSEIYPIVTWTCALGDSLVILLCGLMVLALLTAIRHRGTTAAGLHLFAWVCFCLATVAKQSAFAAPLIVGLVLGLRPGRDARKSPLAYRLRSALLGMTIYGATAAVPFFQAKRLLVTGSPYPIRLSFDALLRTFAYVIWYFGTFEFPTKYIRLQMLPNIAGLLVLCAAVVILIRVPRIWGERPRDVAFCLLAAVASVSLFVVLPARVAPYYGAMAAFWLSLALAIALTRFGWATPENTAGRVCSFLFCTLLLTGFADIRVKQTGLFPSGGYTWGASEVGLEMEIYNGIKQALRRAPETQTLILEDMPNSDGYFAGMAISADPHLKRILAYHSTSMSFLANDTEGKLPSNDFAGLHSPKSYNWNVPLDEPRVARLLAGEQVLRLKFHDGKIESGN